MKRGDAGFQSGMIIPKGKGTMMHCQNIASLSKTKVKYESKDGERRN